MKITSETITKVPLEERFLLKSLLTDINDVNRLINSSTKQLYIDYEDKHTEYSPERTDPCPDYYGCYSIRAIKDDCRIGDYMSIDELDNAIFILYEFLYYVEKS